VATEYKSEISKIPIVVRYELLKQVRRLRLYGLLVIGSIVTAVVIVIVAAVSGVPNASSALDFSLVIVDFGEVTNFALIAGVFFSGDSISSEFEHKTGYLMFANPIKRTTLLLGKYLSSCIACALIVAMPYLILSLSIIVMTGSLPVELFYSFLLAVLYACSIAALTFVFSSLFKGTMGASILPFLLLFFVFPLISVAIGFGGYEPFMFLNYAGGTIVNVLSNPYPPHEFSISTSSAGITITITQFFASLSEGIIIMSSYLVLSLVLSAILVRRRQMA
jgi:ABC-type transport system involved in multi-copper enzyme maturation permease subunit